MKTHLQILEETKERIKHPKNWCKGSMGCLSTTNCFQYCLLGSLYESCQDDHLDLDRIKYNECIKILYESGIPKTYSQFKDIKSIVASWNDSSQRKHEDVIELLDKAIDRVKSGLLE